MTIVFARRGNSSRQKSLNDAVHLAATQFRESYKNTAEVEINIETNQPVQEPVLQAADYVMWAVQRAYEKSQMRYFEFLRDKIELVNDIYDFKKRKTGKHRKRHIYDRRKNPFHINEITPLEELQVRPVPLAEPHLKGNGENADIH